MSKTKDIIVIKFGSGILTRKDGIALDDAQIDGHDKAVSNVHSMG